MMNRLSLKLTLSLIAGLNMIQTSAYVKIDGINYVLDASNHTAKVVNPLADQHKSEYSSTHIDIPDSVLFQYEWYKVTTIDNHAFAYIDIDSNYMKILNVSTSVTSIGDSAFFGCSHRLSVPLNSIEHLGKGVFQNTRYVSWNNTKSWPSKVTEIPAYTFCGSELCEITNMDRVRAIGEMAFAGSKIKTMTLPAGLTRIDAGAFKDIPSLDKILIECDVPPIVDPKAFGENYENNTYRAKLYVNPKDIDYYSTTEPWSRFYSVNDISDVNIPFSRNKVEVKGIKYYLNHDTREACVANSGEYDKNLEDYETFYSGRNVIIPDSIIHNGNTYNVTYIEPRAFFGSHPYFLSLPNTLKVICESAFEFCELPNTLVLPASLERIGARVFETGMTYNDYKLNPDSIPIKWTPSVNVIPDRAFYGNSLNRIELPDNITEIERLAFSSCYNLTSIKLPRDLKKIRYQAFENLSSIEAIIVECTAPPVLEENVFGIDYSNPTYQATLYVPKDQIEYYANTEPWSMFKSAMPLEDFYDNSKFDRTNRVNIDGVNYYLNGYNRLASVADGWDEDKDIPDPSFYKGNITLPEKVEFENVVYRVSTIEPSAFQDASGLTGVVMPESMVMIGENAFRSTENLTDVILPKYLKRIGDNVFYKSGVRNIDWPPTLEKIPDSTFYCSGLKSITFQDGFSTISKCGLAMCKSLSKISLPKTLTYIGSRAFSGSRLEEIILLSTVSPYTYRDAFEKDEADRFWDVYEADVYVPKGSLYSYQKDDPWKYFTHIYEINDSNVNEIFDENTTEIYTLQGIKIAEGEFETTALSSGFYLVKTNGTFKKLVKTPSHKKC